MYNAFTDQTLNLSIHRFSCSRPRSGAPRARRATGPASGGRTRAGKISGAGAGRSERSTSFSFDAQSRPPGGKRLRLAPLVLPRERISFSIPCEIFGGRQFSAVSPTLQPNAHWNDASLIGKRLARSIRVATSSSFALRASRERSSAPASSASGSSPSWRAGSRTGPPRPRRATARAVAQHNEVACGTWSCVGCNQN